MVRREHRDRGLDGAVPEERSPDLTVGRYADADLVDAKR